MLSHNTKALLLCAGLLFSAPIAALASHWSDHMNYIGWDGSHWTAWRDGKGFKHLKRGAPPDTTHTSERIDYRSWDGNYSAQLDPAGGMFCHKPQTSAAQHCDVILNYRDWSNTKFSATLRPNGAKDGFFHSGPVN